MLTGEIPTQDGTVLRCVTSKQAQENTRKKTLQVGILYSETCAHLLSAGSLLMGAQAQIMAIPRRNDSQDMFVLAKSPCLLLSRDHWSVIWGLPIMQRSVLSAIKFLLSDFMLHLELKNSYFTLITTLVTEIFFPLFSTPQHIIRVSIGMRMPYLATSHCSSWVGVTIWELSTLYHSYNMGKLHCFTYTVYHLFVNASQKGKETLYTPLNYSPR